MRMAGIVTTATSYDVSGEIGAMPVLIRTESVELADMLKQRYGGYLNQSAQPGFEFDVETVPPERMSDTEDAANRVRALGRRARGFLRRMGPADAAGPNQAICQPLFD